MKMIDTERSYILEKCQKERTNRIHQYALEHGLIMITAGTFGNVIRTLMPLNIDKANLDEGLEILCNALMEKAKKI